MTEAWIIDALNKLKREQSPDEANSRVQLEIPTYPDYSEYPESRQPTEEKVQRGVFQIDIL